MSAVNFRSKTELVAEAIKSMIQSGELEAGEELHQRRVAERLGVSSTPVREALRRLEAEGFVVSEPHRPTIVAGRDHHELYGNAMMLGALEGLGAELAAKRVTADDIHALAELNDRLAAAEDPRERSLLDRAFHLRIWEVTGYTPLQSQLDLLWRTLGDGHTVETPLEEWVSQHRLIIDALAAGDCSEARDASNDHVLDSFKSYAPAES